MSQHEKKIGQCRHHPRRRSVVADVVRVERVQHSWSDLLVVACIVEASGGQVQDGLLHDDWDEAVVVVPRHVSSVAIALFVAHHPCHHHPPCRPCHLLHHRRRRSPTTLVTVAIALAPLFVTALIISHALSLFVVTCRRDHVHH